MGEVMKKHILLYTLLLTFLTACVVVPIVPQYKGFNPYYSSSGVGASFLEALSQAKENALRLAIIDQIGDTEEIQNRSRLYAYFFADTKPNAYLETDYLHILRREQTYRGYYCEITVPVRIEEVQRANCREITSDLSLNMLIVCCIWLCRMRRQKMEVHFPNLPSIWQINIYSTTDTVQSIMLR